MNTTNTGRSIMPVSLTGYTAEEGRNYVVGFMFGILGDVVLTLKEKPEWQKGKLNGPGGKVELFETPRNAMVREFKEETGLETTPDQWKWFHNMSGINDDHSKFRVDFFCTRSDDVYKVKSQPNEEQVGFIDIQVIYPGAPSMVENLPWLIALAYDMLADGRPDFTMSLYE